MFLARSFSLRVNPNSASACTVIEVSPTSCTCQESNDPSSRGETAYPTLDRFRLENSSVFTMTVPPRGTSARLAFNAAGFIATRTSGRSPGVSTSWSANWTWKLDTPGNVPAGARISAGKLGSVDRSLPRPAVSEVNRSPVNCIPSPESPANRITTRPNRCNGLTLIPTQSPDLVTTACDPRGADPFMLRGT